MFDVNPPENKKVHCLDFLVCRGNGNINLVGRACFPDQNYEDILFPDTIIGVPSSIKTKFSSLIAENLFNSLLQRAFRGEL